MPAQLSSDGVGDGGRKLPSQAKVSTQLLGKQLWTVERVGEIPLKLVHQGDVSNVNIQLKPEIQYWLYPHPPIIPQPPTPYLSFLSSLHHPPHTYPSYHPSTTHPIPILPIIPPPPTPYLSFLSSLHHPPHTYPSYHPSTTHPIPILPIIPPPPTPYLSFLSSLHHPPHTYPSYHPSTTHPIPILPIIPPPPTPYLSFLSSLHHPPHTYPHSLTYYPSHSTILP